MKRLLIGFDDHDSPQGGCTTHFAAIIIDLLFRFGAIFEDYPLLVRLNPAIPWKTRGNAAVALRVRVPRDRVEDVVEALSQASAEYTGGRRHPSSQPGLVIVVDGDERVLAPLYRRSLTDITVMDVAEKYAERIGAILPLGRSRGLIGALSALGALLDGEDYTYELLMYRDPSMWGLPRRVSANALKLIEDRYSPLIFENYDPETRRLLATPRGPDPVLVGIRGEVPEVLLQALEELEVDEPIDGWVIYRTNQATDAHAVERSIASLRPYQTALVTGRVVSEPRILAKGHVITRIGDHTGTIDTAFYKPTGGLNTIARTLAPGDRVRVQGMVKPQNGVLTLNAEKLVIIPAKRWRIQSPLCPRCGAKMKSIGRGKGYRCPKCGYTDRNAVKTVSEENPGNVGAYTVSLSAISHLAKPPIRYGMEKHERPRRPGIFYSGQLAD